MRRWFCVAAILACTMSVAARALPADPPSRGAGSPVSAPASLDQARQQLRRHRAEVSQLEHAVATQKSRGEQASRRLQQQDQTIGELQKQLQALHARSAAGHR